MSGGGKELKSFLAKKLFSISGKQVERETVSGEMGRIRADGNRASCEYD